MTNARTIHVDWYSQRPPRFDGGPQLAYQGDHLSNMVVFDNAPELPNYYLLVEMKTDEAGPVVALPAVLLEGPHWVIPNYYTQICQQITYQVCCKTGSGDYEHHSAKFKGTILPVITHNGEPIDQSPMFDPYMDILDKRVNELVVAAGDIQIDAELKSNSTNPVQNKVVKAAIDGLEEDVAELSDMEPFTSTTDGLVPAPQSKGTKNYFLSGAGTFEASPFPKDAGKGLIAILRAGTYAEDVSAQISALALALGVKESSGGDDISRYEHGMHIPSGTVSRTFLGGNGIDFNKVVFAVKMDSDFIPGTFFLYYGNDKISIGADGAITNNPTDWSMEPSNVGVTIDEADFVTFRWLNPRGWASSKYKNGFRLLYNNWNPCPGYTIYGIKGYKDAEVVFDLEATATAGEMYDTISGSTFAFDTVTGIEVVEVSE